MTSMFYVVGIVFDIFGVYLLTKPLLKSELQIKYISTYVNEWNRSGRGQTELINEDLKKSLEDDNVKGMVGMGFVIFGFVLQLISHIFSDWWVW